MPQTDRFYYANVDLRDNLPDNVLIQEELDEEFTPTGTFHVYNNGILVSKIKANTIQFLEESVKGLIV